MSDIFQTSVLASGSKGNSVLVRTQKSKILIDAGLSGKKIIEAINHIGLDETKLDAVIISHEHSDHIKGAGIICRKFKIPLYITRPTYLSSHSKLGKIPAGVEHFNAGDTFVIGDIKVESFTSPHDAIDSCNFACSPIFDESRRLIVATDLGYTSNLFMIKIQNATTMILESNHDYQMLLEGPYPWPLKQRIKSKEGHLSNKDAREIIEKVMHDRLKNLVLAHLSEENNCPNLAYKNMDDFLKSKNYNINLYVAKQDVPTILLDI